MKKERTPDFLIYFFFEERLVFLLLLLTGVLFYCFAAASVSSEGGADAYQHYFMSRYSWKHPEEFFDLWGKPVFTMLSSPFSQFGMLGTKVYNILASIISSYTCYRIAKKLQLKFAPLAVIFLCFAPIYFIVSISSLTEITFGLILILAVYFMIDEKYRLGAAIVSFLPFARQEGVFIILLFLVYLLYKRKFYAMPFITLGFFLLSIAGYKLFHNFWWIIKAESFEGSHGLYGHGEFLHFLNSSKTITGNVLSVLLILGFIFILKKTLSSKKEIQQKISEELILVYGVFLAFLIGHSYVWWKGIAGSIGLTRVMAGVLPLAAIICLNGFNLVLPVLNKKLWIKVPVIVTMIVLILITPFMVYKIPAQLSDREQVLKEACEWLRTTEHKEKFVYYYDPTVCFLIDRDPFDESQARERIPNVEHPEIDSKNNSIVIWDSGFGTHQMPFERLMSNSAFVLLKAFTPVHPFKTGGRDYEVDVFFRR